MSFGVTPLAVTDSIDWLGASYPVLEFSKGKSVKVIQDFSYGCFSDSVYTYKSKGKKIVFKGDSGSIVRGEVSLGNSDFYTLSLDDKYLREIVIVPAKEPAPGTE